ncbi:MAG: GNVR domain-containing protein [Fidelibacterota bacterium]
MPSLTEHEKTILELIRRYPEIVVNKAERGRIAAEFGMNEKTLRNRIADLKRYGLVSDTGRLLTEEPLVKARGDVPVLAYVRHLLKYKVRIGALVFFTCVIVAVISLIMPKTFRATAVIMPSESEEPTGLFQALQGLPLSGLDIGRNTTDTNRLLAILASRTVREKIVEEFDLMRVYDVETMEEALAALDSDLHFGLQEEGTIRIDMDAKTQWFPGDRSDSNARKLCTGMVNSLVREVDLVNKKLNSTSARLQRTFVEDRLERNRRDLNRAEEKLRSFQERYGTISLPVQTEATIKMAAELNAMILTNEVTYEALEALRNPDSPELKRLELEIASAKEKLASIEDRLPADADGPKGPFPILSEVPDLSMQLVRLERDLEVQNQLYAFLVEQYEQARIQEARDTPTIQVLDWAKEPEKKYRPQRTLMVIISFVLSSVFSVVGILFWERWKELDSSVR